MKIQLMQIWQSADTDLQSAPFNCRICDPFSNTGSIHKYFHTAVGNDR